eukprot:301354_1
MGAACLPTGSDEEKDEETHTEPHQTDCPPLEDPNLQYPEESPYEITWELAKKIRLELAWDQWHRSPEVTKAYDMQRVRVKAEYVNMAAYLTNYLFDAELEKNEEGKLTIKEGALPHATKWTQNNFPYNFSESIQHSLYWCTYQLTLEEILQGIKDNVPEDHKILWWVNPMKFRSVPGLYHVQVLHAPK